MEYDRSAVIDHIQHNVDSELERVVYFYCRHDDNRRQTLEQLLRSVLRQLAIMDSDNVSTLSPSLHGAIVRDYTRKEKQGFASSTLILSETVDLLVCLSKVWPQITVIIDGLDEASKETRAKFFEIFRIIMIRSINLWKVMVSSRRSPEIENVKGDALEISIADPDNKDDIIHYLNEEIISLVDSKQLLAGNVDRELRDLIIDTLSKRASGMYDFF